MFPLRDYWLLLFFANGEVRLYDCAWILRLTSIEKVEKRGFFERAQVEQGQVKWNQTFTLNAAEVYGHSTPLTDGTGGLLKLL